MGDLGLDTAVTQVSDACFTARLSRDWEIWGPMGGYVASVALRAAGAVSPFNRPASLACHNLGVADFNDVDIDVMTLRAARTACSQRVQVTQAGKPILEATVWSAGDVEGLVHDVVEPPDVPEPGELGAITELLTDEERQAGPPYAFWHNVDNKPLDFRREPHSEPVEPVWRAWCRFVPGSTFEDPWLDACRSVILIDVQSWPSAVRQHFGNSQFIAPSLDLYVAFHDPQPGSDWLLTDGYAPVANDGLMGWNGRLWSRDGHLVASGAGQMLCRRVR